MSLNSTNIWQQRPRRKLLSRRHLRKVCLRLVCARSTESDKRTYVQYSWLPDVFRIKNSVRGAFAHSCSYPITRHTFADCSSHCRTRVDHHYSGNHCGLCLVPRKEYYAHELRHSFAGGSCESRIALITGVGPYRSLEQVGLILVFR